MKSSAETEFYELSFYTLSHPDKKYFVHQHTVDAYFAQTADHHIKPIGLIFALVGLYLFIEKNYSGKEVQDAHIRLTKDKKGWPIISLPHDRGAITVANVLAEKPGQTRDSMIKDWCVSVWTAYEESHSVIAKIVQSRLYC